ncbi:hypothetical protein KL930_001289 [Ogataea haglerorum]|uniref:U4/U6.U5 small nuclear ribonucleoprotein 27kDa protein domain-containing protein n=1 Tax=Ogataea haglerorum TaxID=1937702 RepID=A0AAN6D4Z0_9ASCO|nr:uncharacterized protein KL911_003690 [Ogataea haglerorum]KAG7694966.1 hypothetical protein KL915_003199 [Ogataea haglerorum]KAG7698511.1 hypothetical protein KL951_001775 [Ogataea haglerorum]KAG7706291.1 hypothetical protein KL914_003186 [Ogataea haglerorum]KAG7707996.1 hypothetical protein KL950_002622 [Ogataea haglerorum]KAG7717206.1 hypothetical protein KL913_002957 [Ogataea haglerorum]
MPKIQIKLKDRDRAEKLQASKNVKQVEENGNPTNHDRVTELKDRSESSTENKVENDQLKDNLEKESRGRRLSDSQEEPLVENEPGLSSIIGFKDFGSTKNKKVNGNAAFGAKKLPRTEYRQYMNREKGFNRPLSPPRKKKK